MTQAISFGDSLYLEDQVILKIPDLQKIIQDDTASVDARAQAYNDLMAMGKACPAMQQFDFVESDYTKTCNDMTTLLGSKTLEFSNNCALQIKNADGTTKNATLLDYATNKDGDYSLAMNVGSMFDIDRNTNPSPISQDDILKLLNDASGDEKYIDTSKLDKDQTDSGTGLTWKLHENIGCNTKTFDISVHGSLTDWMKGGKVTAK